MPFYFFNLNTLSEKELQTQYNTYAERLIKIKKTKERKKKPSIFYKQIHVCIQLGELALNKVNNDTAAACFYYQSAIRTLDFFKEASSALDSSKRLADKLLIRIQTSLGKSLEQHFTENKGPFFKIR